MGIEDSYNFRRINPNLTTSGLVSAAQLDDLQREGYDAVINLLPDSYDRARPGPRLRVHPRGFRRSHS